MGRFQPMVAMLAGLHLLAGCGGGLADDTQRQVFESHNLMRHAGYAGPGPITSGELARGENQSYRALLARDVCYVVAAYGEPELEELELSVVAPDGETIAQEQVLGRNAVVSFCSESSGEHQVSLTATQGGGSFLLTYWYAREGGAGGEDGGTRLTLGRPVNGVLPPGQRFVDYTLRLRERRSVTIDLQSHEFDTYLYLLRDGMEIDRNDDGGAGLNSRLSVFLRARDLHRQGRQLRRPRLGVVHALGSIRARSRRARAPRA